MPIFCPAFSDCSAGFGIGKHQWEHPDKHVSIDSVKDFIELTQIKIKAGTTGLFMVGGGTPKNFAQDTVVCAEILGFDVPMHKYAIQITVADVRDGACSSSTLKEACSWGKVDVTYEQMVYAEGTTVIPAIASYVYHNGPWKERIQNLEQIIPKIITQEGNESFPLSSLPGSGRNISTFKLLRKISLTSSTLIGPTYTIKIQEKVVYLLIETGDGKQKNYSYRHGCVLRLYRTTGSPRIQGKPLVVGRPEKRGVVAAASYEARRYGIRSAMSSMKAKQLCPDLIFVGSHMEYYKSVSMQIHEIFHEYTDMIEPLALDEAFLDVTENKKNIPLAVDVAREIKKEIKEN